MHSFHTLGTAAAAGTGISMPSSSNRFFDDCVLVLRFGTDLARDGEDFLHDPVGIFLVGDAYI